MQGFCICSGFRGRARGKRCFFFKYGGSSDLIGQAPGQENRFLDQVVQETVVRFEHMHIRSMGGGGATSRNLIFQH